MRDLKVTAIERAIVHLVAPRRNELTLSDLEVEVDDPVETFLLGHIRGGIEDSRAVAAEFHDQRDNRPAALCNRIFNNLETLVSASQAMARHLNTVTEGDNRISDGTLIVVVCRAEVEQGTTRLLSLLKLDPAAGFRPEAEVRAGKLRIKLVLQSDILPSIRERLQKGAFVLPSDEPGEYRVLIVDRQSVDEPADFFMTNFLGAGPILGPRERTDRLHDAFRDARNEVAPELPARQLVALERALDGALAATHVNLDSLIPTLPVPEEIRERIDRRIAASVPDRDFELDPEFARSLVRRVTYEGDNLLRLSVPEEFFEQMIDVRDIEGEDPPMRLITIKTRKWRKK